MLPQVSPVTVGSFNYAPLAVAAVLGSAATWWFASARHWFLAPDTRGKTPAAPGPDPREEQLR